MKLDVRILCLGSEVVGVMGVCVKPRVLTIPFFSYLGVSPIFLANTANNKALQ